MCALIKRLVVMLAMTVFATSGFASNLMVLKPAKGVDEIDLYSPTSGGRFIRSVPVAEVGFPLEILEDRDLGFVVKLQGKRYYIGASDVVTNKVYDVTAQCDSTLVQARGATRGIAGKGCRDGSR